jgi:hypothetical protein
VNANSTFAAAAFALHLGSQISDVDAKLRRALSTGSVGGATSASSVGSPTNAGSAISAGSTSSSTTSTSSATTITSTNDPRNYIATLQNANLEHIPAESQPLGRTVQGVAESLPQPAARIT